jgi:hypothetical protein
MLKRVLKRVTPTGERKIVRRIKAGFIKSYINRNINSVGHKL